MKLKTILILLGILAVLVGLLALLSFFAPPAETLNQPAVKFKGPAGPPEGFRGPTAPPPGY